jgi:hypothetical protein
MDRAYASSDIAAAIRRSREARMRVRARRRNMALAACALLALPAAIGSSFLLFPDNQVAQAAAAGAQSLADLIAARSPGQRTQGALTKTKHARARALPKTQWRPKDLPQIAIRPYVPSLQEVVTAPPLTPPPVQFAFAAIVDTTPLLGGGPLVFTPGPGGFSPPGGSPQTPPEVPGPTPAVPEPATWALMLVGFGLVGWRMRRQPALATAPIRQ